MAVYRCPKCGEVVMKNAKRCINCGLYFDLDHEPVLTEGNGDADKLSREEKRRKGRQEPDESSARAVNLISAY